METRQLPNATYDDGHSFSHHGLQCEADYSPLTHQLTHQFTPCHRPRHQDGQIGQAHDSSDLKANIHVAALLLQHHSA